MCIVYHVQFAMYPDTMIVLPYCLLDSCGAHVIDEPCILLVQRSIMHVRLVHTVQSQYSWTMDIGLRSADRPLRLLKAARRTVYLNYRNRAQGGRRSNMHRALTNHTLVAAGQVRRLPSITLTTGGNATVLCRESVGVLPQIPRNKSFVSKICA